MWFLGKIRDSMENIPLEFGHYMEKNDEEAVSAKSRLSKKLQSIILTPDNIPEFCLPPRLCKSPMAPERNADRPCAVNQRLTSQDCGAVSRTKQDKQGKQMMLTKVSMVAQKAQMSLPFSGEGYGLAGIYESPNTRRKESLFHSKSTGYTLEQTLIKPTRTAALRGNQWNATPSTEGLGFLCKSLSETGSTESDTPSSDDSSPLGSPLISGSCSGLSRPVSTTREDDSAGVQSTSASRCTAGLERAWSSSAVNYSGRRGAVTPFNSSSRIEPCSSHFTVFNSLAPPVLFPLDVVHCQERLQKEQVLVLPGGRGTIRVLTEQMFLSTVRVRVVSVEILRDDGDLGALYCCLSLSLSPGKLQKQESATIKNCRSPVFNEDFFFTELSRDSLDILRLRLKVLVKAPTVRRGTVHGVIVTEPLSQLLPLRPGKGILL